MSRAKKTDIIKDNRIFAWLAIATLLVLSIPLIAMQFTDEVKWTLADFNTMGLLLFGMGSAFIFVARATPRKYRLLVGCIFVLLLFWLWAELAVGVFTTIGS